jgi:hypothetical protein
MRKLILSLIVSAVLVGCTEPAEPVQSVDWYKEHATERTDRLAKCRANPGELSETPNCINAERAESLADSGNRRGLNVQPMTGIKMGGK